MKSDIPKKNEAGAIGTEKPGVPGELESGEAGESAGG
jgi:hypothetical protein